MRGRGGEERIHLQRQLESHQHEKPAQSPAECEDESILILYYINNNNKKRGENVARLIK